MDGYLERALRLAEAAAGEMSAAQLARHPAEGKWSAGEILEHLSRAFSSTTRLLEKHLASGEPAQRRASLGQRWRTLLVIEFAYLPTGRAAPEFTLPQGIAPEQALPQFSQTLAAMDDAITRCERRFGGVKIASHAIFGPLSARQWRRFHWVHTRHHARQIEAMRKS